MSTELKEGSVFTGRYCVIGRIAAGGMGAVYEVQHVETERRCALKVMHAHLFGSDDMRDRFKREAKVAARVDSEFIVDVFDAGVDEATRTPFLVMELLRGQELGKRIKAGGALSGFEVIMYLDQVAQALDKTHRVSVIHRDLKPDNVFLCEREKGPPRVKVLDFGIAKIIADGASGAATTQLIGTPTYMAPEQFRSSSRLTPAVDIYALGMMAYTCLVGVPYWAEESQAGNLFALVAVVGNGPREAASTRALKYGVELPPSFDEWFAIATAAEPTKRFPTATAAIAELARAVQAPAMPQGDHKGLDSTSGSSFPSDACASTGATSGSIVVLESPDTTADVTASGAAATQPFRTARHPGIPVRLAMSVGALAIIGGGVYFYASARPEIPEAGQAPLLVVSTDEPVKISAPTVQAVPVPVGEPTSSLDSPSAQVTVNSQASPTAIPRAIPTPTPEKRVRAVTTTMPKTPTPPPTASAQPTKSAPPRPKFARD